MDIDLIISAVTLHFAALITPGPDLILTIKNSLNFSKLHGFFSAKGFSFGIAIHCLISILGLGWLVKSYPLIIIILTFAGGCYLIWIGIKSIFNLKFSFTIKKSKHPETLLASKSYFSCFCEALMTNLLNPKAALFIFSLFTNVIQKNNSILNLTIISATLILLTFLWFSFVSFMFGNKIIREKYFKYGKILNFIFGIIFISAGLICVTSISDFKNQAI